MDQDLELRHLRYFVAVAEELHFGRAAARLHLAQPSLSQQIRRLEEIVGTPLFLRTSRSVSLTPAGRDLLSRARRTLQNLSRDLAETRTIASGEVGTLHVGFVGSAMLTTLPSIFRAYRQAVPRVHLRLHESFTAQVTEGLLNGSLDAGILRDADPAPTLQLTALFAEPFVAVLPATHPRARQKSLDPAHFRDEPFVYFPRSAGVRAFEKPFALLAEHGFRPNIVQEATHWLTILRLVAAGLGVSVAPACVRHIASPEVVCLPLRGGARIRSEVQLAHAAAAPRPLVQRFAQLVRSRASPTRRRPRSAD